MTNQQLCRCGLPPVFKLKSCAECSLKSKKRQSDRRAKRLAAGVCSECGGTPLVTTRRCEKCNDITNDSITKLRRALRQEVIDHYGGVCACCGEISREFLTIDHINGGGNQHRKELKSKGSEALHRWLKKNNFPEGFRVLCFNCNCALGIYGYCPHKKLLPLVLEFS